MSLKDLNDDQRVYFYSKLENKQKDPDTYAVVLWVFGSLGGHRFYLGQIVHGLVHMIIGMLGWLILLVGVAQEEPNLFVMITGILIIIADGFLWFKDLIFQKRDIYLFN